MVQRRGLNCQRSDGQAVWGRGFSRDKTNREEQARGFSPAKGSEAGGDRSRDAWKTRSNAFWTHNAFDLVVPPHPPEPLAWPFKPAERNAKTVPVYMTIDIDFHLY